MSELVSLVVPIYNVEIIFECVWIVLNTKPIQI